MDNAVALVQAYLHVNGYFTVTEYPVLEAMHAGDYQTATDLDVLAFRFPGAGRLVPATGRDGVRDEVLEPDPALGIPADRADMLIGEVKERRAELNRGATNPVVLRAVLTRFGRCAAVHVPAVVHDLMRTGHAVTASGHRVRLVAFGAVPGHVSTTGDSRPGAQNPRYDVIPLAHVVQFLQDYLRRYWDILRHAQFKDPAFGFLVTLEKALGGHGSEGE